MKWYFSIVPLSALLSLSAFFSSGCCATKKTLTETRTTYRIDTIYRVRLDFGVSSGSLQLDNFLKGDTLKAENQTSRAVSYYNPTAHKVELRLTGKMFSVPVQLQATKTEKKKDIQRKGQPFYFWMLMGAIIVATIFLIFKQFTILKKL